ncbi:hypothetical protein O3M35_004269 [Rhynocoris fuscipes]|uniref:Uncharacterized protein n=1 Tax=Rhynocoris fuscipes TaxID=488301 RepID=A0AAW1CHT6_9HEMI
MVTPAIFSISSFGEKWVMKGWNLNTGSMLSEYTGDYEKNEKHYLSVSNGCILEASRGKPTINVWYMNRYNKDLTGRIVAPGRINAFDATNDHKYICFSIDKTVYLYQAQSGNLSVIDYHFQTVSVVKFSNDGRTIACGGEDGFLSVWNLGNILCGNTKEPQKLFTDHCLQINDIVFSSGVHRPWIVSISLDRTAKVYDLSSGNLLISILFDFTLTCILISKNNSELYIGQNNGDIYQINFNDIPEIKECHLNDMKSFEKFLGHTDIITSMSITQDSLNLISGSKDTTIRIWNTLSKHCIKIIQEKGEVKNVFFTYISSLIFLNDYKPKFLFKPIKLQNNFKNKLIHVENNNKKLKILLNNQFNFENIDDNLNDNENFENIENLKYVNKFLYELCLKNYNFRISKY